MVNALQVLFIHLQQGDPEGGHLPLDLLQLGLLGLGLGHVLLGGLGGLHLGAVHGLAGGVLRVLQNDLGLVFGLLQGVLGQLLGAEKGLFDAVLFLPVRLDLLGQNRQFLLGFGIFRG